MSLNMVPEDQLPSSGVEMEQIDFPIPLLFVRAKMASLTFQSICQKLDKHGV